MAPEVSSDSKPYTVAIVGGGLGGILLAIGLATHKVPFHLYEASSDFGEIGAGVAFGPNSVRALRLISPAVFEAFSRHASTNESPERARTFASFRWGKVEDGLEGVNPGDLIFHLDHDGSDGHTRHCVHRAEFLHEVASLLPPGSTSFGKSLTTIEDHSGQKLLRFADGSSATADVIVGCDGVHSRTRRCIHGEGSSTTYSGGYTYRALVPRAAAEAVLPLDLVRNGQIYVGRGGYMVMYPIRNGEVINMGAQVWDGKPWTHSTWLRPAGAAALRADFTGWHSALVELLVTHSSADQWGLFDYTHALPYAKGRVCLLGDAAHASTPHLGAGAGMAFEDAAVLSRLLGQADRLEDVDGKLEQYDRARRPRTQELVRLSRLNVKTYAFLDEEVGADLNKLQQVQKARYFWVWDGNFEQGPAIDDGGSAEGSSVL